MPVSGILGDGRSIWMISLIVNSAFRICAQWRRYPDALGRMLDAEQGAVIDLQAEAVSEIGVQQMTQQGPADPGMADHQ